jgi:A/G-specific adenine glycosylase
MAPSSNNVPVSTFASRLLAWWDAQGRKDLPWQHDRTPYRVWVSEIMLQQTQVSTVIGYYQRFMTRFPDLRALADASLDEVLHHWTGLGYYARARNLHRAAQLVRDAFNGELPAEPMTLQTLPGIGRSTASAIHALAGGGRSAILDGNVKRVLARWRGIDGWTGDKAIETRLWALSDALLPASHMPEYTQAIIDLGATLCTRSKPGCERCPLRDDCIAHATNRTAVLPIPRPQRAMPERQVHMWLIITAEGLLLQRRPTSGLWGGLWGFPESAGPDALPDILEAAGLGTAVDYTADALPELTHTFTHFRLSITPMRVRLPPGFNSTVLMEPDRFVWFTPGHHTIGVTGAVTRVLEAHPLSLPQAGADDAAAGALR